MTDIWSNDRMDPGNMDSEREVVSVTLKAGTGFDAPWIVFHAASLGEAEEMLKGSDNLQELAAKAARTFQQGFGGSAPAKAGGGSYPRSKPATEPSGAVPEDVASFLDGYSGSFPFLVDLSTQFAERGSLSVNQVASVRKCMAREGKK